MTVHVQNSIEMQGAPARRLPIAQPATVAKAPVKDTALLGALSIVTHDLRGPLSNLGLLMEMIDGLIGVDEPGRAAAATRKARLMIDTMSRMLDGYLERASRTGDPLSLVPTLVDLGEAIASAIELNRPRAAMRDIRFDCSGVRPFAVDGDHRLLTEAVENLISNAIRHSPDGGTVHCSVEAKTGSIVLKVRDHGAGLTDVELARTLRPFSSLSKAGPAEGHGIGLWIVRLIAERHGGALEVRRGASGGTTLALRLPASGL